MADVPLLGCPHCGKPIGFAPELAGKLAACPHCRGPFQMPSSLPQPAAGSAPHIPASMPSASRKPAPQLGFDPDSMPATCEPGMRRGNEPFCYPGAERISLIACIAGVVFTLMLGGVLMLGFVVPMFQLPGTRAFLIAFLAAVGVLALIVGGIAGSLLLRHLVLVFVDAAKNRRISSNG